MRVYQKQNIDYKKWKEKEPIDNTQMGCLSFTEKGLEVWVASPYDFCYSFNENGVGKIISWLKGKKRKEKKILGQDKRDWLILQQDPGDCSLCDVIFHDHTEYNDYSETYFINDFKEWLEEMMSDVEVC